jgi:NAD(P)H-hydrate epimerase
MTEGLDETPEGMVAHSAVDKVLAIDADAVVAGPGLGQSESVRTFVRNLLDRCEGPLVLDADALNAFANEPAALVGREGRDLIITPHPGEMARLVGCTVDDLQADRIGIARDFARRHKLYVVLKGYRTLVVTPDEKVFVNPTGSPAMATGGTGDVLAGMLASLLAQLLDAEAACKLAVYLHGSAGELADADSGEVSMTAGDLVDHIGDAILEVTARRRVAHKSSE